MIRKELAIQFHKIHKNSIKATLINNFTDNKFTADISSNIASIEGKTLFWDHKYTITNDSLIFHVEEYSSE